MPRVKRGVTARARHKKVLTAVLKNVSSVSCGLPVSTPLLVSVV